MISIQRPWWAVVALLAMTWGCADSSAPPSAPANPTPTPASSMPTNPPEATTPAVPEPARDADKDMDKAAPDADKSKVETPDIKIEGPKPEAPATKGEAAKAADKLTDEEIAEIKKLPPADQPIALKQMVCPISGEHLGTPDMGTPVKIALDGKTVFLCCSGCKKEAQADPKATLAKLKVQ